MRLTHTKLTLSVLTILYLFILNSITNASLPNIISSFWLALLMLVIILIFSFLPKIIFKFFLATQILITSIALFVKSSYKVTLTTDIMLSGLMNESDLTLEMVSIELLIWVFITAIIPIIFLFIAKVKKTGLFHQLIQNLIISTVCFSLIFCYLLTQGYSFRSKGNIRDPRFVTDLANFSPLDAEYNLHRASRAYKKLKEHQTHIDNLSELYHYQSNIDDLIVVLVIGETTRGDHFGLNGYKLNTTPKLAKIDNLYSFANATSCDTLTVNSVYCMTSNLIKSDDTRLPTQSSVGEVLHSIGYSNEIYSLQTMSIFYNYLKYDKLVSKYAILNEQSVGSKDVALIPYAQKAFNEANGNNFIILHTLGSHQTYADRLSKNDEVFKPFCTYPDVTQCDSKQLNNAFDNTIIAVDSFLATVIDSLQNKKAILIYASDHGESLGENNQYFHGQPINSAPDEQFKIPFLVWFSDEYLADSQGNKNAKNLISKWQLNQNDKFSVSHDNIFHSLLGCSGVYSQYGIDKSLNLCADNDQNLSNTKQ